MPYTSSGRFYVSRPGGSRNYNPPPSGPVASYPTAYRPTADARYNIGGGSYYREAPATSLEGFQDSVTGVWDMRVSETEFHQQIEQSGLNHLEQDAARAARQEARREMVRRAGRVAKFAGRLGRSANAISQYIDWLSTIRNRQAFERAGTVQADFPGWVLDFDCPTAQFITSYSGHLNAPACGSFVMDNAFKPWDVDTFSTTVTAWHYQYTDGVGHHHCEPRWRMHWPQPAGSAARTTSWGLTAPKSLFPPTWPLGGPVRANSVWHQTGPAPVRQGQPRAVPSPALSPTMTWGGGGTPTYTPSTYRHMQPGPRTRERKHSMAPWFFAVMRVAWAITETNDFIKAVWRALPKKDRTPNATIQQMFLDIWNHTEDINIAKMWLNVIANHFTDVVVGRMTAGAQRALRQRGFTHWSIPSIGPDFQVWTHS